LQVRQRMMFVDAPVHRFRSKSLFRVSGGTSPNEVLRQLQERGISSLPVTEGDSLLGIVSLTDLAKAGCASPPGFPETASSAYRSIAELMSKPVITVDDDDSIRDAARAMLTHKIHRVVVTKAGVAVGVLSTRDLMKAVREAKVERKLRDVITRDVKVIDVEASIDAALRMLQDSDVRGLVVVDGEWPVGAFTQLEALYAQSLPVSLRQQSVERIMSYETICFDEDTPVYRVAGHAVAMSARRILAVSQRRLVGIATGVDLARIVADIW
jgi:predicted transcriptional regulator